MKPSWVIKKDVYTKQQLEQLFLINENMPQAIPFGAALALAVFTMSSISNLVLLSECYFGSQRQLVGNDIAIHDDYAAVRLRWAKNLQCSDQTHILRVPRLQACPVRALQRLLNHLPSLPNVPLIMWDINHLMERVLRKSLMLLNLRLGLQGGGLTFHALRRTGVTFGIWGGCVVGSYMCSLGLVRQTRSGSM